MSNNNTIYINRRLTVALILLLVMVAGCTGLAGEPDIVRTLPARPTFIPSRQETFDAKVNIQQGATIYAENCVRCHGITGAGDGELAVSGQVPNIPNFTDPLATQDMSLQLWFDTITNGRLEALMPPWKESLSAQERWAVALYTYTLPYAQDIVTQGEAIYTEQCADCHALDGSGTDAGNSLLGLVDYTQANLQSRLTVHQGELEVSPAFNEDELTAVTQYIRLLSSESQTLPDPDSVASELLPAVTEDAMSVLTPQATPIPIPETIGILRGRISQGTEGGASVEGLEAILHIFDSQLREQIAEYTVDSEGAFQYEEVIIRPDHAYVMTVEYDGVTYSSPVVIGNPDESDMVVDVTIYEKGATQSDIVVSSRATQVNLSSQGLYVIEVIDLVNMSDRAYIRDDTESISSMVSVEFALPEGAQLQPEHTDPNRIMLSNDGLKIMDMTAVLPNQEHYIQYSYLLPIQNARHIQQPIDYAVEGPIMFYIDDSHLIFKSDQTAFVETLPFNEQSYSVYELKNTPEVGDVLTYSVEVNSMPGVGTTTEQAVSRDLLALILVLGGVILVGVAGFIIWRNRTSSHDTEDSITPEQLMQEIAALDDAFEAGKLNAVDYKKRRNQLKSDLMNWITRKK